MIADPTATDIAHAVDTTWTDVDVTALVGSDAGSVAGICIEIENTSATLFAVGARCNGSSDTYTGDLATTGGQTSSIQLCVGVDDNDVFELYLEDASEANCYLIGYWTDAEAEFLVDAQLIPDPASAETWTS